MADPRVRDLTSRTPRTVWKGAAPDTRGAPSSPVSHARQPGLHGVKPDGPARIGIDARPLRWPGIGRYVSALFDQLAEIDTSDLFFVYCDSEKIAERFRGRWPHVRVTMLSSGLYTVAEQLELPLRIAIDRLDLFHAPASLVVPIVRSCPLVVTLHDLLLHNHPEHLPSRLAHYYFSVVNAVALRAARQILTVSEFTRNELVTAYPQYAHKTRTIHNAAADAFQPQRDERRIARLRARLALRGRYLLYVGTYKKHKNLPFLVEAYAGLPQELRAGCQLLLLGPRDARYPEVDALIARHHLERDVVQIERVDEDDLAALYGASEAVVAPSIYEGFGFPVLEGMACGTAVIATRIPAFVEVAGDCAILVEPGDGPGMTAALASLLNDHDLRDRLATAGLERSALFSWRRAGVETLAAYRDALGTGGSRGKDGQR